MRIHVFSYVSIAHAVAPGVQSESRRQIRTQASAHRRELPKQHDISTDGLHRRSRPLAFAQSIVGRTVRNSHRAESVTRYIRRERLRCPVRSGTSNTHFQQAVYPGPAPALYIKSRCRRMHNARTSVRLPAAYPRHRHVTCRTTNPTRCRPSWRKRPSL